MTKYELNDFNGIKGVYQDLCNDYDLYDEQNELEKDGYKFFNESQDVWNSDTDLTVHTEMEKDGSIVCCDEIIFKNGKIIYKNEIIAEYE